MLTEEQAATKWCPVAMARRVLSQDGGKTMECKTVVAANRTMDGEPMTNCRCVASDCMVWKWSIDIRPGFVRDESPNEPRTGFCSLAAGRAL